MNFLTRILTAITIGGVLGAFIDFYIGKDGQRRVRDWLATWWLKFSYIRWDNIGHDEAIFAVSVMDRLFGRRLFSRRRWIAVALFTIIFGIYVLFLQAIKDMNFQWLTYREFWYHQD